MMAAMSSADRPFGPCLRRGQAEDEAIDGREIGRPLPGAIADEQLVFEQQRLGGDGADAAGAKELREGDQQVDGKDEDFPHRANRTMTASACKAARRVRIASHWEFATHRLYCSGWSFRIVFSTVPSRESDPLALVP
jgi:hypothetical protein